MKRTNGEIIDENSLLYSLYKDRIDPDTNVPDAFMSVRRAAAFARVSQQLIARQVKAGLLPTRSRGTRKDVNPADVVRLNYDKNGVRQLVSLQTGERKAFRLEVADDSTAWKKAAEAIRYYPEWLEEVDEYIAFAESKGGIAAPRWNKHPMSISNMHGDKTGKAAQILADMPKRLQTKAQWVRIVYYVVYRKKMMVNIKAGVSARTYLELYLWGVLPTTHGEMAAMLGINERTSRRYMEAIKDAVAIEAIRAGLA